MTKGLKIKVKFLFGNDFNKLIPLVFYFDKIYRL
jgi:hypothetical protein